MAIQNAKLIQNLETMLGQAANTHQATIYMVTPAEELVTKAVDLATDYTNEQIIVYVGGNKVPQADNDVNLHSFLYNGTSEFEAKVTALGPIGRAVVGKLDDATLKLIIKNYALNQLEAKYIAAGNRMLNPEQYETRDNQVTMFAELIKWQNKK
ncbi:Uncharacterised protein [Candidatus Tiddalikarchaeum anstoanum]|nr:Uncharacterised protein [Candidatus Tiddalikarchaeum anstoanum]